MKKSSTSTTSPSERIASHCYHHGIQRTTVRMCLTVVLICMLSSYYVTTTKTFLHVNAQQSSSLRQHPDHTYVGMRHPPNRTRIEGLTPYEQQEVVSYKQVMERFPEAFRAQRPQTSPEFEGAGGEGLGFLTTNKLIEQDDSTYPKKPYLYLGFAKMGTTSITGFWNCAGRRRGYMGSCHYLAKKKGGERPSIEKCFLNATYHNEPLLTSCGYPQKCTGFAQMEDYTYGRITQLDHLEQILKEEPGATLFLPFRNFLKWVESQVKWQLSHSGHIIEKRDYFSPYPGLDAFDREFSNPRQRLHRDSITITQRQQINQAHFLYECLWNRSGVHTQDTVNIFQQIDRMRGGDNVARLALFWVYYVTYLRSFASARPQTNLIEFDLEDPTTGDYMLDLFQIPHDDPRRSYCWKHAIPGGATSSHTI